MSLNYFLSNSVLSTSLYERAKELGMEYTTAFISKANHTVNRTNIAMISQSAGCFDTLELKRYFSNNFFYKKYLNHLTNPTLISVDYNRYYTDTIEELKSLETYSNWYIVFENKDQMLEFKLAN